MLGLERKEVPTDTAPVDTASVSCPMEYITITDLASRYRIITTTVRFSVQKDACTADGTHLAAIDTLDEMRELRARAQAEATATLRDFYVGVVQDPGSMVVQENWYVVTGEPLDPALWADNQPNDGGPDMFEDGQEGVATIDVDRDGLSDNPANLSYGAICECDGKPAVR